MGKLAWYWHRLSAMDSGEVLARVREQALKIMEPWQRGDAENIQLITQSAECIKLPPPLAAKEEWKQLLRLDTERLIKGKWQVYGWRNVQVEVPPAWSKDPVNQIDLKGQRSIDHRHLPNGADVRNIWEINRWSEIVRLGMNGYLNQDASSFETAIEWLYHWTQENPAYEGVNWSSPLEAALRVINFCWFDALAVQSGLLKDEVELSRLALLRNQIVPQHVWWIRRYLSFGSSANNHLLGELTALLMTVNCWPELSAMIGEAEWCEREITRCLLDQFEEDGGNKEQALHYHLFAFELGWLACTVSGKMAKARQRLDTASAYFVQMVHESESWDYGDSDDAQVLPLTAYRQHAGKEWARWMAGEKSFLHYWLGEGPHISELPTDDGWWLAPLTGMASMRRNHWQIRLDASALGYGSMAAHGHADALHVSVWDGDYALIIDPGTGAYFADVPWRAELASWSAHNAPQPEVGFQTPRRSGCFLWRDNHEVPSLSTLRTTASALLNHEGYVISRTIDMGDASCVQIKDAISPSINVISRWFFAPECEVNQVNQHTILLYRDGRHWEMNFSSESINLVLTQGQASRHYGQSEACTVLEVKGCAAYNILLKRVEQIEGE